MNVGDMVKKMLCEQGIEHATAVEVSFDDGRRVTISSEDAPILNQPAQGVQSVTPKQSAQGG